MKRKMVLCAALLALCLCLSCFVSCGGKAETDIIRIGVALYFQDDTFISTIGQSIEQLAKDAELELGTKINLNVADGKGIQATQNEQVDRFLSQGCDVICVNIVDRTAAAVIIDKAKTAGVPVIFFNRQPVEEDLARWDGAYYVGSRAEESGRLQGSILLDAWRADPEAIDRNGDDVVQYLMLEGEPGHQDALLRTEYSIKVLTQAGVTTEKLANGTANWYRGQAATITAGWLESFGSAIEVIFANNDDMALGAIDACLATGMTLEALPFIVGVDATPPALEALSLGTLKGTVLNDGEGQADAMLKLACALAAGESPHSAVTLSGGKYVWLPYKTIIKENLEDNLS